MSDGLRPVRVRWRSTIDPRGTIFVNDCLLDGDTTEADLPLMIAVRRYGQEWMAGNVEIVEVTSLPDAV